MLMMANTRLWIASYADTLQYYVTFSSGPNDVFLAILGVADLLLVVTKSY